MSADLVREIAELRAALAARDQALIETQAVAKVGSWTTDLLTFAVTWSRETHRIFGTDPQTFQPTHAAFLDLVHPEDRAAVDSAFLASIGTTEPREIEHRVVAADGSRRMVKERWQVFVGPEGRPERAVGTCQDVTEQHAAEAARLRSQRLESIGNLAGGMAHDLNNILAPILMSVALLKEDEQDPERLETLRTVEECAQRGSDLVRQVLTYARGRADVHVPVDLATVIRHVVRVLRETFPRGVDLDVALAEDVPLVLGDVTQLHQVLMNLAVNARDALGGTGRIAIRLRSEGNGPLRQAVIEVEDTGCGMSPEVQEQMFDPFFTTKAVGHGTGLGLPTVRAIVRSHGGEISAVSEVGAGTVFTVRLPCAAGEVAHPAASSELSTVHGANQMILVVDDEEAIRVMARKTLERHGYRVLLAQHGAEAVDLYARHGADIHLVITDMSMPVMDGPAAIRLLRSMNPQIRIIASSGVESLGGAARAIGTGSVLFIPKPYTADVLLRAVGKAIETC